MFEMTGRRCRTKVNEIVEAMPKILPSYWTEWEHNDKFTDKICQIGDLEALQSMAKYIEEKKQEGRDAFDRKVLDELEANEALSLIHLHGDPDADPDPKNADKKDGGVLANVQEHKHHWALRDYLDKCREDNYQHPDADTLYIEEDDQELK